MSELKIPVSLWEAENDLYLMTMRLYDRIGVIPYDIWKEILIPKVLKDYNISSEDFINYTKTVNRYRHNIIDGLK
jgi:hypothetical protein